MLLTFAVRALSAIINLLLAVVVSHALGAEGKGVQGLLLATITLILIISNIISGATLVYLAPRYQLSPLFILATVWSLFVSVLSYFIIVFLNLVPSDLIFHIAAISFIASLFSFTSSVFLGKEKIQLVNLLSFLQVSLILFIVFVAFNLFQFYSVYSYIIALYVSWGLTFLIGIYFLYPWFEKIEIKSFFDPLREMFKIGITNQLAHIFQLLSFRIAFYFIEKYHGMSDLGVYSNTVSVVESIWMISASISIVLYSRISNSTNRSESAELTARFARSGFLLSACAALVIIVLPPSFYIRLFGKEFYEISSIMPYIAPGVAFFTYALIVGHYFSGTGRYFVNAIASACGFVISLLFAIILIPQMGIAGAAMAATISYTITSLVVIIWFLRENNKGITELIPWAGDLLDLTNQLKTEIIKKNEKVI